MKKPARAKASPAKPSPKAKQPGNAPGRGKAAHAKKAPAKPAHVPAKVKQARHAAAVKASKTRAANAKKAKNHPRRQLALGAGVACCSAEALAASLRRSGWLVSDADVLALYWHTARDEHAGASILATLEAAAEFGLAGVRPVSFGAVSFGLGLWPHDWQATETVRQLFNGVAGRDLEPRQVFVPGGHAVQGTPGLAGVRPVSIQALGLNLEYDPASFKFPCILGLALPAPHAVLDTGSEWMSWGEPWPVSAFGDVVIEEAWEVRW